MAANIRIGFQQGLHKIQDDMVRLGSMVSAAIGDSMKALKERDTDLARRVIAGDAAVNDLRFSIEADAIALIAKQQPVAVDLRTIVAVLNIALELERMGDHAAGIAKIAVEIGNKPPLKPLIDLPRMAEICREMLGESLDAFVSRDAGRANQIAYRDDEVDNLYNQIFRELLSFMIEDPKTITRAMYLLFVGHNLERIADRVTNICERITFQATGKMEELPGAPSAISL